MVTEPKEAEKLVNLKDASYGNWFEEKENLTETESNFLQRQIKLRNSSRLRIKNSPREHKKEIIEVNDSEKVHLTRKDLLLENLLTAEKHSKRKKGIRKTVGSEMLRGN